MTGRPVVAIIPWGNVIEDYLDGIGRSLDDFTGRMSGGWLFGFADALASAGVSPALVCVSVAVCEPQRRHHAPSGMPVWILPAPRAYRWLRAHLDDPYAWSWRAAVADRRGAARAGQLVAWALAPYVSVPLRALRRALRAERCDAVLAQEYEDGRFDLVVALGRLVGIPVFATFQGGNVTRSRLERLLRTRSLRAAAGLVIGAHGELERVAATYPAARVHGIPNPVEVPPPMDRDAARRRLGIDTAVTAVLWYGRVDLDGKGLDVLLDAWERCCGARPDAALVLLLVGTGPDAATVHRRIRERGLRNVRWHDEFVIDREVLAVHRAAADVFAFPSRREGFAVAPMEALAAGLPVVAADASGVADLLSGGGGVVVPRDDPVAFADALGAFVDDAAERRRVGEVARAAVAGRFSVGAVGRRLADVLVGAGRA